MSLLCISFKYVSNNKLSNYTYSILDIDYLSQHFDSSEINLFSQTIHCGLEENCYISCKSIDGIFKACQNTTFYIYDYPTIISCESLGSCGYVTIISTNTISLEIDIDGASGFDSGYLIVQNSTDISISCKNYNCMLCCSYL